MGMFSSLFGSSGSDKADRLRQAALDAFNSIQTPELKDLQVQLDKYVQAGQLTPEQAEVQLLNSNAYNNIITDPSLEGAQKQALVGLQNVANSGGLTAIDKAQLQDITNEQNQVAKSRNASIMQNAQERGMGGSDINTVNQLLNEQSAADRASQRGTDVAAQAQARALQALIASGDTAGKIRGQDYGEQENKAKAENAIDLFNKQTLNQNNLYNIQQANQAQAANLANAQSVANANTATSNANKEYNAQQNQQIYNDALQKAQGVAGVNNAWANDATAQAAREKGADMGITAGILQGGATALGAMAGGPPGAVAANSLTSPHAPPSYAPKKEDELPGFDKGGEVCSYCSGGMCMKHGGKVPGKAKVAGDSPKNDTVDAKLSPGELVVPRSAANDDEEFDAFMEKFRPSKRNKPVDGKIPLEHQALANLHKRLLDLEGK